MAEERTKTHTILLSVNSKKTMLELFPADAWPAHSTDENLYRVRIDGRWHCPFGKYSFLTLAAVGELAATLLAGGVPVEPEGPPAWMRKGVEIRAHYGPCVCGVPLQTYRGYILEAPQLAPDGRWYALCQLTMKGRRFVPVCDVEPLRR